MKKTITKIGALLFALIAMPTIANAEVRFDIECAKSSLDPGESTTCTYVATADPTEAARPGVTEILVAIRATDNLTITDITPGSGFTDESTQAPGLIEAEVLLESKDTGGVTDETFEVLTVEVKLDENATDVCGSICMGVTSYVEGTDTNTTIETCEDIELGGENPPTGAFSSYLILGAGALIAIGAMVALKDKKKFHNV